MVAALLLVIAVSSLGVAAGGPAPAATAQTPTTYTNPNGIGTSPFTFKSGSTYYRYVDGFDYPTPFIIPVLSSPDLVNWTWVGNAMQVADVGAWANASSGWNFTAPSVLRAPDVGGVPQYVLYFTGVQVGTGKKCIGHAVATSPVGPFHGAASPLICPSSGEAMDPSPTPVPGADYQQILFRKTGSSPGIYNQVLMTNGQAVNPASGMLYRVFTADAAAWANGPDYWQSGVVERPSVAVAPDNAYHLVFSGTDPITHSRAVGSVTCGNGFGFVGTCQAAPPDGGRLFGSTPQVTSPGRPYAFRDGTNMWLTYDATTPGGVYIDKLCVSGGKLRTNAPTVAATALARNADCTVDIPGAWAGSWTVALGGTFCDSAAPPTPPPCTLLVDKTLRQMVHTSIGGSALRVRIANLNELTNALNISDASVAVATDDDGETSAIQPTTLKPLTFGGSASVAIPPGEEVISDPVALTVPEDHDIAVSLHLPGPAVARTGHVISMETSHIGPDKLVDSAGDGVGTDDVFTHPPEAQSLYVSGVDVLATNPLGSVVILGDSLTDHIAEWGQPGVPDFQDTELRWPDKLVDRMKTPGPVRIGVMNHAWIGTPLLPNGLEWMDQRILRRGAITTVVVAMGQNDVWFRASPKTSTQIIDGLKEIINEGHAAGLRVVGTTIAPYAWRDAGPGGDFDHPGPPCYDNSISTDEQTMEGRRDTVNAWILNPPAGSPRFDAVIDLDATLRESAPFAGPMPYADRPELGLLTQTDCIHLTAAAHALVANAVNLTTLVP